MTRAHCVDCGNPVSRMTELRCRPCYFDEERRKSVASLTGRFWAKVERRGPDECWPWTGWTTSQGYGVIGLGGRDEKAHRAAWIVTRGPIPRGLVIRHTCDNPPCVNPTHLLLGTQLDNIRDRVERGRSAKTNESIRGDRHWSARRKRAA